jgi:hypothetical protein
MTISLNEFALSVAGRKDDDHNALPLQEFIAHAEASLPVSLPDTGLGFDKMKQHLLEDLVPAFNGTSLSSNFYGFVTGGNTDAALFADWLVSGYDQNVQVYLASS